MQIIPLLALPAQTMNVVLGTQTCTITVTQKAQGLFLDLDIDGKPALASALCRDRVRIVRETYLGLTGDLAFVDTQGDADPLYTGLGDRWQLVYFSASELQGS